jgi:hypothetical protein
VAIEAPAVVFENSFYIGDQGSAVAFEAGEITISRTSCKVKKITHMCNNAPEILMLLYLKK